MTQAVQHIDVAELQRMLQQDGARLLDVRTEAETARGIIAGAQCIPLHLLPARAAELDSRAPLIVSCQSGGRSAQACAWLTAQGFERVFNLHGGVLAWIREGKDLTASH